MGEPGASGAGRNFAQLPLSCAAGTDDWGRSSDIRLHTSNYLVNEQQVSIVPRYAVS